MSRSRNEGLLHVCKTDDRRTMIFAPFRDIGGVTEVIQEPLFPKMQVLVRVEP